MRHKERETIMFSSEIISSLLAPPPIASPSHLPPRRPIAAAAAAAVSCLSDEPSSPTASSEPHRRSPQRGSSQLNRWSRARTIRSGRRLDRSVPLKDAAPAPTPSPSLAESSLSVTADEEVDDAEGRGEGTMAKAIYMVSDGTGWTVEHSVNAALGQFEPCLIDRGCPVNTHLFSGVEDVDRLMEIIKQAATEGALVLYTLTDNSMAESAKQACQVWRVPSTDILRPTIEAIASHLGVAPSGIPRGAPGRNSLTADYFKRIEAIDFTIKQDDGAQPKNLTRADIVLVGVSRTGKTPLSIYLAQKGYKVANVPIVMGVALPKILFEINQEKVFGLTISPVVLQTIRKVRVKGLGFSGDMRSNYSEMDHVKEELDFAHRIFSQNPVWPVIEVTGKAIEETAAVVVRSYHDRNKRCSMPRISKWY